MKFNPWVGEASLHSWSSRLVNSDPSKVGELYSGETPMIAICRAVVSAKLGDEVEIPDELMEVRGV